MPAIKLKLGLQNKEYVKKTSPSAEPFSFVNKIREVEQCQT